MKGGVYIPSASFLAGVHFGKTENKPRSKRSFKNETGSHVSRLEITITALVVNHILLVKNTTTNNNS